jgi:pyruvate formate lyase activating enzyme
MKSNMQSRREFLLTLSKGGLLVFGSRLGLVNFSDILQDNDFYKYAPVARYWINVDSKGAKCADCHSPRDFKADSSYKHSSKIIKCLLCAQGCVLKENQTGKCRARANVNGVLKSLVYGRPITTHVDPIEKKPFYHFLPGSSAYSLATAGCPLSCQFCQNWSISQAKPEDYKGNYIKADVIADNAKVGEIPVIAFTYNEPTVFIEYLIDIAGLAKAKNIRSVMVSCGFMNHEPLKDLCSVLDAIKIDLKGFSEAFYRKVCNAELKPVLRSIKQVAQSKTHLEIVNLVVPTLNDSDRMLHYLTDWIVNEIGPDVPIHFTRFHPDFKLLNLPPTPVAVLEKAHDIARSKGIRYAYVGNVPGHKDNNTYCPSCKKMIIKRANFFVEEIRMKKGRCEYCNFPIAGVWK